MILKDKVNFKLKRSDESLMAKWKKDQKKFFVKLFYDDRRGCMIVIPKPIVEKFKNPEGIIFEIKKNGTISVVGGNNK